ncbi:MAG: sigma-54 dependent transcriptional regulator [Gemmatimonadota bacterium]|nr:sigma-54 dependent transcriptional regulator [Gemmatimonadota bacterium]
MHIIIVDDEIVVADTLGQYLAEHGHKTDCFSDGDQALEAVREYSPDMVITDLRMPAMDGMALLKKIREIDSNIEVIMISGYGDMDLVIKAYRAGAFGWIKKPIDFRELDLVLESTGKYHRVRLERHRARRQLDLMEQDSATSSRIDDIIGSSPAILEMKELIRKVARTSHTTVLVTGETGTGKELVARAIHRLSSRAKGPFIPVNCTSLTPGIAESELFGHEPGAFTGARGRKSGYFELAQTGTLFLDEIGDMQHGLQSQLLRVLEQFSFFRVGGKREISVDVRVIAATNKNLRQLTTEGAFRLDLLHRLEVFTIQTPPLRTIGPDIEALAGFLIETCNRELKKDIRGIEPEVFKALKDYAFPGNIRELRNMIERAMILTGGNVLSLDDFPAILREETPAAELPEGLPHGGNLIEMEQRMIRWALDHSGMVKRRAAELLGISREALRRRMEKYDIEG